MLPQVPINDKKFYPFYAKCVELDIPICVTHRHPRPAGAGGLPGDDAHRRGLLVLPRAQVRDAPRRRAVGRPRRQAHAQVAEPLLLHQRVRPEVLPRGHRRYANTRGADKVMYAGYFPMGLSLERIFKELPDVPFRDNVWPKFLRENAQRVFKLMSRVPVPDPVRVVLRRLPRGLPHRRARSRCTTSAATSSAGATPSGEVHVMDAFCPHLGAHLGHGGHVDGCEIVCPFHGWQFDADGHNTRHPLQRAHQQEGRHPRLPRGRAQRRGDGLVPPARRGAEVGRPEHPASSRAIPTSAR